MYSDADIEAMELEAAARNVAALRRAGICCHGWTQGGTDQRGNKRAGKCCVCLECGALFATENDMQYAHEMARDLGELIEPIRKLPVDGHGGYTPTT